MGMQGLLTAFETLASQAFGSSNNARVGILLQRALLVLGIAFVPVAFLWTYMYPIMIAFSQPHDVAVLAERYIKRLLIGLVPLWIFESTRRCAGLPCELGTLKLLVIGCCDNGMREKD